MSVTTPSAQFPRLGLAETLDNAREEFVDFTLSPEDHPSVLMYKTPTGDKPRAGVFWCEISKLRTLDGELRFPSLAKLMAGLLTIPASNADSERGFSISRRIYTDQRPTLKQSTICSLMTINSEEYCFETTFCSELLTKCFA